MASAPIGPRVDFNELYVQVPVLVACECLVGRAVRVAVIENRIRHFVIVDQAASHEVGRPIERELGSHGVMEHLPSAYQVFELATVVDAVHPGDRKLHGVARDRLR
jgi:hypothetical protein